MTESIFTNDLKKRVIKKYKNGLWYKIPDFFGQDGVKRPFDAFFFHKDAGFWGIESKLHKSLSPFSFSKVEPHQIKYLRTVHDNHGKGFLVIGIRCMTKEYDRKKLDSDISRVLVNLWIDCEAIPGERDCIEVKALKVRDIILDNISSLRGNRVNEIYLQKGSIEPYFK